MNYIIFHHSCLKNQSECVQLDKKLPRSIFSNPIIKIRDPRTARCELVRKFWGFFGPGAVRSFFQKIGPGVARSDVLKFSRSWYGAVRFLILPLWCGAVRVNEPYHDWIRIFQPIMISFVLSLIAPISQITLKTDILKTQFRHSQRS